MLKDILKEHWPSRTQYQQWSMPSKLTFLGTYFGLLSLVITVATLIVTTIIKSTIDDALIRGKWDAEIANEAVLALMKKYGGPEEYGLKCRVKSECSMVHQIFDQYYVKYAERDAMVVLGYSNLDKLDCHACMVHFSVVEFAKGPDGWSIASAYLNSFEDGSWGGPPGSIRLLAIGYDIFGIVIEYGYTNQGITQTYTTIYAPIGGELRKLFSEITGSHYGNGHEHEPIYDDAGNVVAYNYRENWEATIEVRQHGTSFYDLYVEETGEKSDGVTNQLFRFDGRKYSKSELYR